MKAMLTRVYVDNFRCFVNFDFRPGPRQLLLGRNGTGKSTLFEVLRRIRDFSVRGKAGDDLFMDDTLTRWQQVPEQRFLLEVQGNGGQYGYQLWVDSWGTPPRPRVRSETVIFDGQPSFQFADGEVHLFNDRHEDKVAYPFDWHRSALATINPRPENTKLTWFKHWLGAVQCMHIDPRRMAVEPEKEAANPDYDLRNYASWYQHLLHEEMETMEDFFKSLREVIDGFYVFALRGEGRRQVLKALFKYGADGVPGSERREKFEFTFDELSDGQRTLIALYTLLHYAVRPHATLCIDEPDNFLSLPEIQPWLDRLLDKAEQEHAQIMLISHHPELLNQLAVDCGVVFDLVGDRQVKVEPYKGSPDSELPPAEQIARGWANA